eukprot:2757675-Pleurochrysis_carterae.AAC.1
MAGPLMRFPTYFWREKESRLLNLRRNSQYSRWCRRAYARRFARMQRTYSTGSPAVADAIVTEELALVAQHLGASASLTSGTGCAKMRPTRRHRNAGAGSG